MDAGEGPFLVTWFPRRGSLFWETKPPPHPPRRHPRPFPGHSKLGRAARPLSSVAHVELRDCQRRQVDRGSSSIFVPFEDGAGGGARGRRTWGEGWALAAPTSDVMSRGNFGPWRAGDLPGDRLFIVTRFSLNIPGARFRDGPRKSKTAQSPPPCFSPRREDLTGRMGNQSG